MDTLINEQIITIEEIKESSINIKIQNKKAFLPKELFEFSPIISGGKAIFQVFERNDKTRYFQITKLND